jgi:hypothetical protein
MVRRQGIICFEPWWPSFILVVAGFGFSAFALRNIMTVCPVPDRLFERPDVNFLGGEGA